jgi:hypothetical protein
MPTRYIRQRGAASLIVVTLLLLLMTMVAAFASRRLVVEQQTSATQYRQNQAFEAAEAGLQWALAMLNGGRIDERCEADAAADEGTFRDRYLVIDEVDGRLMPSPLGAGCVMTNAGWSCSCPSAGEPALARPESPGAHPAFTVRLNATDQPGLVGITAYGCSSVGAACPPTSGDRRAAVVELTMLAASVQAPVEPLQEQTVSFARVPGSWRDF